MTNDRTKALFIRLDRIGDLVLTLPVDQSLADRLDTRWWINAGLGFLPANAVPKRPYAEIGKDIDRRGFWRLWRSLRQDRPDVAVVFHGPWWVGLLLWLARVPVRVGKRSQWHSFLFFNRGVRQKRSRAECNELEYNYRLVEQGLRLPERSLERGSLALRATGEGTLERHGLAPGGYFVVHPGMGGSALNWPTSHYVELVRRLAPTAPIAVTGTKQDASYLAEIKQALASDERVIWLDGQLTGAQLIAVLQSARAVLAPSTGVLHVAASTGAPTLGIFSPVRVQSPTRWGPQGRAVATLAPEVQCPGQMSCLGSSCAAYNCMERVSVEDVARNMLTMATHGDNK